MPKIFITAISLFCVLIFGNFMILPKYRDLKILKAEVSETQTELSFKEEYISQLESLSQELEKYSEELSKINFALPPGFNLPPFFEFLQKACSENGLIFKNIGSFVNLDPQKDENIKRIAIEFEVSGHLDSLLNFLKSLEKSARLIEVSNIYFSSPQEGDIFSFKISIKIHSYD